MAYPEIALANFQTIYDTLAERRQHPLLARVAHHLGGLGVNLHVTYDPGVEEGIRTEHEAGRAILIAPHHVSYTDHEALAELPLASPACRHLMGTTVIGAKAEVFDEAEPAETGPRKFSIINAAYNAIKNIFYL